MTNGPIEFDSEALRAAEHWHDGQSSMLYAIASTGSLARGTIRPRSYDADRPMSDVEWIGYLVDNLEGETETAIERCMEMDAGDDNEGDLDGLQSILSTIEDWRLTATPDI